MSTQNTFLQDSNEALYFELLVPQLLNIPNFRQPEVAERKYFDILNLDTNEMYEVKADNRTWETGNLCIEFAYRGEDSGITSTKADYYIYFVRSPHNAHGYYCYYKIPIRVLKSTINNMRSKRTIKCGYQNRSECYLVNQMKFAEYRVDHN